MSGRDEVAGARRDFASPLGSANQSGGLGNFTGKMSEIAGVSNATGGFLTTGVIFTSFAGGTDFYFDVTLMVSSSALATGGINFRFVRTQGHVECALHGSFTGPLVPKYTNVSDATTVGPFCTFDCSTIATVGGGTVYLSGVLIGLNTPGSTVDLQFQNVVGAETYTITFGLVKLFNFS